MGMHSPRNGTSADGLGDPPVYSVLRERQARELALQAQKLESLTLLAGGLAHDFNNLLVGILTAADLLHRDLDPGSEQRGLAEIIKKAAERAAGLTRQLLIYAGKGAAARQPVILNAVVEAALDSLRATLPGNVALVTALDPTLPPTDADPGQVQQVVSNLVLNAAEAIGTGPGTIRLTTGIEMVSGAAHAAPALPAGHYIFLEVADDGCGMAAEVQPRIFDPFFSTKGRGRGLGLSAVQGIVRAHGGGLRVTSAPGAGSAIHVLLPAAAPRPAHALEAAADVPVSPRGRTVLLVDDEPVVRGVVTRALGHCGLQVRCAASGRDALELLRTGGDAIGLVLLDLGIWGQDGLQTLAALRAEQPSLRVVLTSASDPGQALTRAGLQPPTAFLAKPYTVHALLECVERALNAV